MNQPVILFVIARVVFAANTPAPTEPSNNPQQEPNPISKWIREVMVITSQLEGAFRGPTVLDYMEAGPSGLEAISGTRDSATSDAIQIMNLPDELAAGPSNAQPPSRPTTRYDILSEKLRESAELYRYNRDLEEMRREMDLTWPPQPESVPLSDRDEIDTLQFQYNALANTRDTLQRILNFMEQSASFRDPSEEPEQYNQVRQRMEEMRSNIRSSCELMDVYRSLIKKVKEQIDRIESGPSTSNSEPKNPHTEE